MVDTPLEENNIRSHERGPCELITTYSYPDPNKIWPSKLTQLCIASNYSYQRIKRSKHIPLSTQFGPGSLMHHLAREGKKPGADLLTRANENYLTTIRRDRPTDPNWVRWTRSSELSAALASARNTNLATCLEAKAAEGVNYVNMLACGQAGRPGLARRDYESVKRTMKINEIPE